MKQADQPIRVSDHAVLRWLERECGVPVERIRTLIGEGCAPYADSQPVSIIVGRTKFLVIDGVVVTTLRHRHRHRGHPKRAQKKGRRHG
ncbi:MAG: hypothetical protein AAFO77_08815 [Pseudomonadota bacterium]